MPYPTIADIHARYPDLNAPKFSDDMIAGLIEDFRDIAERYRGVAYTATTVTERFTVQAPTRFLRLRPFVSAVTAVSVDGEAQAGPWVPTADDFLPGRWGCGTVEVTYAHGIDTPPLVRRACMAFVRREAREEVNPGGNTIVTQNTDLGIIERAASADWSAGRPTGWLDVDRMLNQLDDHRDRGPA